MDAVAQQVAAGAGLSDVAQRVRDQLRMEIRAEVEATVREQVQAECSQEMDRLRTLAKGKKPMTRADLSPTLSAAEAALRDEVMSREVWLQEAGREAEERVAAMRRQLEYAERRAERAERAVAEVAAGSNANPLYTAAHPLDVESNPAVLRGRLQEAERELARSRKELKLKSIAFQNLKAKQDAGRDPLMRRAAAGEATPAPPQSERVATTVRPQSAAATTAGRGRVPPPLVIPADSAELDSLRQDLEAARAQLTAYEAAGAHLTPSQLEIKTAVRAITTLAKKYEVMRAEREEMRNQLKGYAEDGESDVGSDGEDSSTLTPNSKLKKKKAREKEASTEAVLQAIMAEAEADVASQARTEAELRKMLAETTDRCSRLQWQSEMADRRLDLIRHNSTDAPGGSASRPQSAKATSPKGQLEEVQKELKAAKERGDQQDKLLIRSARRITALEGENSALKVALQASDEEVQRAERRLADKATEEALQGGFGSNIGSNIGPEGGEHHEQAAALALELQAETARLQDEVYRLQETLAEAEEKTEALSRTLHMFRCPNVNEAYKFHSEVVFPMHLYAATAFAKLPKKEETGTPVFAMINKSGVRLMPVDGAADAMDIFFGIGEVQLYQVVKEHFYIKCRVNGTPLNYVLEGTWMASQCINVRIRTDIAHAGALPTEPD